jgi:hypothetical protein
MIASSSSAGLKEKPCRIACLKVPPGGSWPGLVQYTPVTSRRSCPPYAYSLSPITTPECKRELPIAHKTVDTFPGGNRSYMCMVTSVLCRERVLLCWPELFRAGFGRVDEDMMRIV